MNNRTDHPISYLDTLMKTESESIEAIIMRRRRIPFAGFVVRVEDETAEVCDVRRMGGGARCDGGQEKEWMGCFLDNLRTFGINADQWTTAAQDKGEWRKAAEQGAERFKAKWAAAEKPGLDNGMQYYARV